MFSFNDQFSTAAKANFEAQLSALTALTTKAFEGVEKIVDLNLNAAKASLEDSAVTSRQLLASKDPQEFFSLFVAQFQPTAAKTIAYNRHFATIAAGLQADLTKATEEQIAETSRKVSDLVEDISKNAPQGSKNLFGGDLFGGIKTSLGTLTAGYEQFSKTSKQAAEVIEANFNNAVNQFTQAAEKTAATATAAANRARKA
ncbi:phasin family protein [Noviherbaspirillum humi]|uniref:Phasin family protein n=1 Tax=Noviherbaspirillum humi TaxID=1688639 RepID=A0A239KCA7_9BURK|nr:phasin family protein [Noviherbaspirillum humi]SNT15259.1 phasin family protein [Noviherbaspirillum humi]